MVAAIEEPKRLFCWTVCAYRKRGMSEEDYHHYLSEKHAPLVKGLLAKYGLLTYSITHNTSSTKELMAKITGPQFNCHSDYDSIITIVFRDVEDFVKMKKDPLYFSTIMPDHENFADTERSRMSVGWTEDHVLDGKVVG